MPVRLALLGVLVLGLAGSLAELLLIAHDEDVQQMIPIVLLGSALPLAVWLALRPSAVGVRLLRVLMLAFIGAGCLGIYFHVRANIEFQRELEPSLTGTALIQNVLRAKSPPTLSPGLMVQLGLVGLISTWGHPSLRRSTQASKGAQT